MPAWDVIDTAHGQSNVIVAAGILCSHPLLISANNNDYRHCAFINVGFSSTGPFTPSRELIVTRPIVFIPIPLWLAGLPAVIAPSIRITYWREDRRGSESDSYPFGYWEEGGMESTCFDCGYPL